MSGPFQLMTSASLSHSGLPLLGVPALGSAADRQIGLQPHERGEPLEAHPLDRDAVGIGEGEEPAAERPEKGASALRVRGREPRHPDVGLLEDRQDALTRVEHPRALARVRVEAHDQEVEVGEPLCDGALLAVDGRELEIARGVARHGGRR